MSVMDTLLELSNSSTKHGQNMYRLALQHSINMIEIDAEHGLAKLKEELAELEKEGSNE